MCAPDKGDDALVMGVDRELVSIPSTIVQVSDTESFLAPLAEYTFKVKPMGSLGLTDISADIQMSQLPTVIPNVKRSLADGVLTVTVQLRFRLSEEPKVVAKVTLKYTTDTGEAIVRDIDILAVGDASIQPLKNEIDQKQDIISDLDDIRENSNLGASVVQEEGVLKDDLVFKGTLDNPTGKMGGFEIGEDFNRRVVHENGSASQMTVSASFITNQEESVEEDGVKDIASISMSDATLTVLTAKWRGLQSVADTQCRTLVTPHGIVIDQQATGRQITIDDGTGDIYVTDNRNGTETHISPTDITVTNADGEEISLADLASRVAALERKWISPIL